MTRGHSSPPAGLTLFAIPKPFKAHIGVIQRNAITSWTLLRPRPEILLFGDEAGTAELAHGLGLRHLPDVERTDQGTPLVSDLFNRAQEAAGNDLLGYVNADIVLMSDLRQAIGHVAEKLERFLVVGQRWDVDVDGPLPIGREGWEAELRSALKDRGKLHEKTGMDYFVFPRGLFGDIPPFAVGRTVWDNWLVYRARAQRVPVVDATHAVTAVHQNHGYGEIGGFDLVWKGPEALRNQSMMVGTLFTVEDATLQLVGDDLLPTLSLRTLPRRVWKSTFLNPSLGFLQPPLRAIRSLGPGVRAQPGQAPAGTHGDGR